MAFRLRSDESVAHGLRRLAAKNLRVAGDDLERGGPPSEEAIHDARKRVKKVRAILHLVREAGGRHLKNSHKQLRKVNRRLSPIRDADATLEILATIRERSPEVISEHAFARVRRTLAQHKYKTVRAARRARSYEKAIKALRGLRKRSKRWRSRHDDFEAIARGIRTTHRRAAAAMARALETGAAADFHEWRKQIKTLWYELRLLAASGGTVQKDIATLDAVEELLGDDHNVAVLRNRLARSKTALSEPEIDALRSAAERYRQQLRRQAVATARPIFKLSPKDYVRRIERAWKRWRRGASSSDGNKATAA